MKANKLTLHPRCVCNWGRVRVADSERELECEGLSLVPSDPALVMRRPVGLNYAKTTDLRALQGLERYVES